MAYDYGMIKLIPSWSRPYAPVVFMTGHAILYSVGLLLLALPFQGQTICVILGMFWAIKNGATFYMTYFWKVYDKQIHEAERQMAKAQAAMEKGESRSFESDEDDDSCNARQAVPQTDGPISDSSEEDEPEETPAIYSTPKSSPDRRSRFRTL